MSLKILTFFFFCTLVASQTPSYIKECSMIFIENRDHYCKEYLYNTINCFPWSTSLCRFDLTNSPYCISYNCKVCKISNLKYKINNKFI